MTINRFFENILFDAKWYSRRISSTVIKKFRRLLNNLFYRSACWYSFCDEHHLSIFKPICIAIAKITERIDLYFDGLTPEFITELTRTIIEEANKED